MKKVLSIILILCMAAFLIACGGKNADTPSGGAEAPAGGAETPAGGAETPAGNAGAQWPAQAGIFDPDYDYSQHKTFKIAYLLTHASPMFDTYDQGFKSWAPKLNLNYTGMWAPTVANSADEFLSGLETYCSQGYDGLMIDIDPTLSPRVKQICAEYGVPWVECVAQARDYSNPYLIGDQPISGPLQNPSVGFNEKLIGSSMMYKLIEWKDATYPDVPWDQVGVIAVGYSIVPVLNERTLGAKQVWCQLHPEFGSYSPGNNDLPRNFWYADGASGGMDTTTAHTLVTQILSSESQIKVWLIPTTFDDYAMGAANAVFGMDMTDIACVVTNGGNQMVAQLDAGVENAWRYSLMSVSSIYVNYCINALWAQMAGQATIEDLWPEWVCIWDKGDVFEYTGEIDSMYNVPIVAFGADGKPVTTATHSYASRLLPTFWIDKDNYKPFLAWCDLISFGSDTSQYLYPSYPAVTDVNLYSLDLTPPDYYRAYPTS